MAKNPVAEAIVDNLLEEDWTGWEPATVAARISMCRSAIREASLWPEEAKPKKLLRKMVRAASSCHGCFAELAKIDSYTSHWVSGELTAKEHRLLVASGSLPWEADDASRYFQFALPSSKTGQPLHRCLSHLLERAACAVDPIASNVEPLEGFFSKVEAHLRTAGGAKAKPLSVSMAIDWIRSNPQAINPADLPKESQARIDRLLSLVEASPEQALAFNQAAAQARMEARAIHARASLANAWGTPALWAIRDDSAPALAQLGAGAASAGVDFATQLFMPAAKLKWEDRHSAAEDVAARAERPSAPKTLLHWAIDARSPACSLALAALPGASKPFFGDDGACLARNPFMALRHALSAPDDGGWTERFHDISRLLAEDLLERGADRDACARAVAQAADKGLARKQGKPSAGASALLRAVMLQRACMAQWSDGALPDQAAKRVSRSL